jgi:hypothetical protein
MVAYSSLDYMHRDWLVLPDPNSAWMAIEKDEVFCKMRIQAYLIPDLWPVSSH